MKRVLAGILPVVAAVTLAGCSSSSGGSGSAARSSSGAEDASNSGAASTAATTKAPNPVDVLRKTGAEVPAGASGVDGPNGTRETRGVYFATEADRQSGAGEQIAVTTYPSNAARNESGDVPANSDDAHWYITFDRGLIVVTGVEDAASASVVFGLPADTIAKRVNGKLLARD